MKLPHALIMHRALLAPTLLFCILGFLPLGAFGQGAAVGVITGQITNGESSRPLSGAILTVEGYPALSVITNSQGRFILHQVPPGLQMIRVEYTGFDVDRMPVQVKAGETVTASRELNSSIYKLEAISVSAVREGQALSINRQRTAPNVENIVSVDAFGNVADTNVGNLLIKLPGVTPVRDEAETYRISVRGINPSLNSVSVDGTLLAGATTRGTDRSFEIDKVSTNSIESIEVVKSPTPDMDADSIGGKINLRTKSALDRGGREVIYSLGANTYLQRMRSHPSGSLVYSDAVGPGQRIGISLSASFNRTFSPRAAFRSAYVTPTPDNNTPVAIKDFQTAEDDILLDRLGLGGKLEFRLSDATTLFVNTLYNDFTDSMQQHKQRVRLNSGVLSEVTDKITAFDHGQFEYEMEERVRTVTTGLIQVGGRTNWDNYHFDYDISHSESYGTEKRHDLSLRINDVGYRVNRTYDLYYPRFTQISGPDVSNYDNGYTDFLSAKNFEAWDDVSAAQFNVQREFDTKYPTYLKTGLRYRSQQKRQDRATPVWVYVGPDGVAGPVNGVSDDNLNRFRGDGHTYEPLDGRYSLPAWPDWLEMHKEIPERPDLYRPNVDSTIRSELKDDNESGEDIYAAYLMGNIKTGRLSSLLGVRVEKTETSGTSPVFDPTKATVAEQWGTTKSVSGSYSNVFPGVHLKYEATPRTVLRASFSTSIGRPNFDQLFPGTNIDVTNSVVRENNPALAPQFSDNYDLSAEYYFGGVGMISVGLFRKDLTDFAYDIDEPIGNGADNGFDGDYAGYTLRTRTNGGWAKVNGLEFSYQQQLTFLPEVFNGFGVYANFTMLDTTGNYGGTEVLDDIAGFVKRSGNLGISYIKHGLTLRTSANYVGRALTSYTANPNERQFQEPRVSVDVSLKYQLNPRLGFFIDVSNVFNEEYTQYQAYSNRPTNTQLYGSRMTTGITGSF